MPDLTFDDLNAQFDDLQAAVTKEETDVQAYIDSLKAQLASGAPVTVAQLTALSTKFAGVKTMVTGFDLNNSVPPVVPAPLPTV